MWKDPTREYGTAWTVDLLREWTAALPTVDAMNLVWLICSRPGRHRGVTTTELQPYIAPEDPPSQARSRMAHAVSAANRIGRRMGTCGMPFTKDERRRLYSAAPEVAQIVLDELAKAPQWPELAHHRPVADGNSRLDNGS